MSQSETNVEKKAIGKKITAHWQWLLAGALWVIFISWYYLPIPPEVIEKYYSNGIYRINVAAIASLTSAVPFSIIIVIIAIVPAAFISGWASVWIYRRKTQKSPHWKCALWGIKYIVLAVPIVGLWFLMFWGIGYQRPPLEKRLLFDTSEINKEEIEHLQNALLEIIIRDQPKTESDRNVPRAIKAVACAMRQIVQDWDGTPVVIPDRVKATPPGFLLVNGTSGMCVPLTLEPHVDGGLPDTSFVAVAAHELGHIAGLCDEGETNLLGYAAGLASGDAYARYAVALSIYRSIARGDSDAVKQLPQQAKDDLQRAAEASQRYRIKWIQEWSWRAYNHYLKAQGVQDGVQSYGRGTQLLVYAWRAGHIALPPLSLIKETL